MADEEVKLAKIPESLLKRRKKASANKTKAIKAEIKNKKKQKAKRRVTFKRAEKFVKDYRTRERDGIRLSRLAKRGGSFSVPTEAKLAFVIRIRGNSGIHQQPRKVLSLFKLRQVNNAVFLGLNKTTLAMLKIAEPYIAWGIPSLKTVRELIYKRGYGRVNGRKVPLTDNSVIEQEMANQGIICMEDIIHEIVTIGTSFKHACNFLWPFALSPPLGGWHRLNRHYKNGGDHGYRDTNIDDLVKQMI